MTNTSNFYFLRETYYRSAEQRQIHTHGESRALSPAFKLRQSHTPYYAHRPHLAEVSHEQPISNGCILRHLCKLCVFAAGKLTGKIIQQSCQHKTLPFMRRKLAGMTPHVRFEEDRNKRFHACRHEAASLPIFIHLLGTSPSSHRWISTQFPSGSFA